MSPRLRGSPDRERVDPVFPWGRFVEHNLPSHRPRGSNDEAAETVTREAELDGERNARFDRYNIRSWLLGAEPRKKSWRWIVRAWNLRMEDFVAAIDEHRTWKANQRHAPATPQPQLLPALQLTDREPTILRTPSSSEDEDSTNRRTFIIGTGATIGAILLADRDNRADTLERLERALVRPALDTPTLDY